MTLVRLTSFDFVQGGIGFLPVWVNPATVAYVQPRHRYHPDEGDSIDGSLLYFQQEAGVLAVREETDYVIVAFGERLIG